MTELSYGDVQRAVQDGLRNMQADVQRLNSQVSQISQQSQLIDRIQQTVQQLEAHVTRLSQETRRHDPISEQATAQAARDMQDLKTRFVVVEKFCQDMSRYVQSKLEEDQEDKQYRTV